MPRLMNTFLHRDDGTITVDFTTITAGVVGLGLTTVGALSAGQNELAGSIGSALSNAFVAGDTLL